MSVRIGLGLANFQFSDANAFWRWVDLCEAGDIDSIWQSDSIVSTEPFLECMSVMAALAGATSRLKFGMSVLALGLRDPFMIARQCATIDYLSNGRLLPAFGIGALAMPDWNILGIPSEGQGARMDEALEIIERLWRGDLVDFEGRFFRYKGASFLPLPVQVPMPLWLGGSSKAAIRRTGRFGTGWQAGLESPDEVAATIASIHLAAESCGRTIDPEHFSAGFFYRIAPSGGSEAETYRAEMRKRFSGADIDHAVVIGEASRVVERINEFKAAGVTKFILRPIGQGNNEIFAQTRHLIDKVIPHIE